MDRQARHELIEELFHAALALDAGERNDFLDRSCASDPSLLSEVQSLISEHEGATSFMASPAYVIESELLVGPEGSLAGKSLGHFTIQERIGAGGMGEVYRARDTKLGREVAIKVLSEAVTHDTLRLRRFEREARMLASLNHSNIATIHSLEESNGICFIVMELLPGETLDDRINRASVPLREVLLILTQTATALQAAHEKGIIHRDLKPANIQLLPGGGLKVLDFGLAKATDVQPGPADLTIDTVSRVMITGTPAYLSPEQVRGELLDTRVDIWAFGCVAYEALTRERAFKGKNLLEIAGGVLNLEPDWSRMPASTPGAIRALIERCMEKDRERRPDIATARTEIEQALQSLDAPVLGEQQLPASSLPAIRTTARRRAWLIFAVLALLIVAVPGIWWLQQRYFKSAAASLAFQARDWILITDFENATGEEVFSGSLEAAMTASIQQSQHIYVFPRTRVAATLKRMRRENVKKLDESLGTEVALREGIKGLLACSISKVGGNYLVAARVVDPNTQMAVYSQSVQAEGSNQVLAAIDAVAEKIRRELGESLANISHQRVPLVQATTPSLDALRCLSQSSVVGRKEGLALLQHALELDPDFAQAHAHLGMYYYIEGDQVTGEKHFKKALSLLGPLSLRERLWIQAVVEDWRGNREQGIENYKAYLTQYPDDGTAWFRLGYTYMITNRFAPAVEAFKKVINLDPSSSSAYVNLASVYNGMHKDELALETYEKAFQSAPDLITGIYINGEYGFLLLRMGEIEKAGETFRKMLSVNDLGTKARGHRSLAFLNAYRGKYSAAIQDFEQTILMNKAAKQKLSEMVDHLYLASILPTKGLDAEREMASARRIQSEISVSPFFLFQTGTLYARQGKIAEAMRLLAELKAALNQKPAYSGVNQSNQRDQAAFTLLSAEIELTRKRHKQALDLIELVRMVDADLAKEPRAFALLQSGDVSGALSAYTDLLNQSPTGNRSPEPWILAHYQLGRLYERKGDLDKAREYYGKFLHIWREGDQDLLPLNDARRRLTALKGRTGTG